MFRQILLAGAFFVVLSTYTMSQQINVLSSDTLLSFPWTGGLDACQFGEMDLDSDGIHDLLVFDRRGNRLLAFRNEGVPNHISYSYHPELVINFPPLFEWAIFADYDQDGLNDIFTYSPGWAGIKVYRQRNTIPPTFELVVSPYLTSLQGGGYVNIIATNADYPAIADVDGDGDLDLLTFWALGTYIELHLNQSMEKYGHADSLDFKKTEFCWGRVAENEENNLLYLDSCLYNQKVPESAKGTRHRGATMLMHDFDANGLPDMLLADVDYPGITLLKNHGTADEALITAQDTAFPSYSTPVRLFSMPLPAMLDVNNDHQKDLLVSPFDPNHLVTENAQSIWLYLNHGTNSLPDFRLVMKDFLQNQTIDLGSGAYPTLSDINSDGVPDLVAGNHGRHVRSWIENNTLHSEFTASLTLFLGSRDGNTFRLQRENSDFAQLSQTRRKSLAPAFADINSDGISELLVGSDNGKLMLCERQTTGDYVLTDSAFLNIDLGGYSTPQFFDLDEDGITDLLVGAQNGKIAWFKGTYSGNNITFILKTDFLGQVQVTDPNLSYDGFSTPFFFYDHQKKIRLICGSEQGACYLYDQIRGNLDGAFQPANDWQELFGAVQQMPDAGMRSSVLVSGQITENKLHLFTGNFSGGLQLLNGDVAVAPALEEQHKTHLFAFPNPMVDRLWVRSDGWDGFKGRVRLLSLQGKIVLENGYDPHTPLNVSHHPSGTYILQLQDENRVAYQKIIKK